MAAFIVRQLLLLIPGLLGVFAVGFAWVCIAATGDPPGEPHQQAFARDHGFELPSVLNTRFALGRDDVDPLVDACDPTRRPAVSPREHARRAAAANRQLLAYGRDALPALIDRLADVHADVRQRTEALCRKWGAMLQLQEAGFASGAAGGYPTERYGRGFALDRVLADPALLAALEDPRVRDLLPDARRMRSHELTLARDTAARARETLVLPEVVALLLDDDARRDLADHADLRIRRRHVARLVATIYRASFASWPMPDEDGWLDELQLRGLITDGDRLAAADDVADGFLATRADHIRGMDLVSHDLDEMIRQHLLRLRPGATEVTADRVVRRWVSWRDANALRLQRTAGESAQMLFLETKLARYSRNFLPDATAGRLLPAVGRTSSGELVWEALAWRAPVSLVLLLLPLALGALLALGGGMWWAVRQARGASRLLTLLAYLGGALPVITIGTLIAVTIGPSWLGHDIERAANASRHLPTLELFGYYIRSFVLPVLVLTMAVFPLLMAGVMRRVRLAVASSHVLAARARGLDDSTIVWTHVMPAAQVAVVGSLGRVLPPLLGGLMIAEWLFAIDGVGRFGIDAILARDPGPVLAVLLVTGAFTLVMRAASRILAAALDPRTPTRIRI